jgi:glyoxylase-like metal-dependent hydrolase (beta-lactamase superfamily II)
MNLYDSAADVVRKAIIGSGLSPAVVATKAGMSSRDLAGFLAGEFSPIVANSLAPTLGLNPQALSQLPNYEPDTKLPAGVVQVSLPFEDEEVNVWMIETAETRIAIDCGSAPDDFRKALDARTTLSNHLFITHVHRDHIGGLTSARPNFRTVHSPSRLPGTELIAANEIIEVGPFKIRTVDLAGHHPQALGYFIDGLGLRLLAVGDAIFAGSIGGCPDPAAFDQARKSITDTISKATPDLILLPGHGPATCVKNELSSNPFLAAWMP